MTSSKLKYLAIAWLISAIMLASVIFLVEPAMFAEISQERVWFYVVGPSLLALGSLRFWDEGKSFSMRGALTRIVITFALVLVIVLVLAIRSI